MSGKGFLGNMTENLQADCVQSRQAGFMQCFLYKIKASYDLPPYRFAAIPRLPDTESRR